MVTEKFRTFEIFCNNLPQEHLNSSETITCQEGLLMRVEVKAFTATFVPDSKMGTRKLLASLMDHIYNILLKCSYTCLLLPTTRNCCLYVADSKCTSQSRTEFSICMELSFSVYLIRIHQYRFRLVLWPTHELIKYLLSFAYSNKPHRNICTVPTRSKNICKWQGTHMTVFECSA